METPYSWTLRTRLQLFYAIYATCQMPDKGWPISIPLWTQLHMTDKWKLFLRILKETNKQKQQPK